MTRRITPEAKTLLGNNGSAIDLLGAGRMSSASGDKAAWHSICAVRRENEITFKPKFKCRLDLRIKSGFARRGAKPLSF
jgi:hypothetical protein